MPLEFGFTNSHELGAVRSRGAAALSQTVSREIRVLLEDSGAAALSQTDLVVLFQDQVPIWTAPRMREIRTRSPRMRLVSRVFETRTSFLRCT